MWIMDQLRKVWNKLLRKEIGKTVSMDVSISSAMEDAIVLWGKMYGNSPPWKREGMKTLNIPAAIASEMAKTVVLELEAKVSGSARANYINTEMNNKVFGKVRDIAEFMIAKGGVVIKPYVNGQDIEVDIVQAEHFYPVSFDSNGNITSAFFDDFEFAGDVRYIRLEFHELVDGHYTITNKAYKKEGWKKKRDSNDDDLGKECQLTEVDRWAEIEPVVEVEDVEHVFFSYGKMPGANHIDTGSPLGVSIYSKAVEIIEEADEQWARIWREYKEKEVVVQVTSEMFEKDRNDNPIIPEGNERRYEIFDTDKAPDGKISDFIKEWSPDIRDSSMFSGLNKLLQRIEFLSGLSYGVISDPIDFEKTATEIKSSKQRMYTTVTDIQKALQELLDDAVFVADELIDLYELAPEGEYETSYNWDDSIVVDQDVEYQRRWSWVAAGKYSLEAFYAWYFNCSEDEAKSYIPKIENPYPEEE